MIKWNQYYVCNRHKALCCLTALWSLQMLPIVVVVIIING